MIPKIKNHFFTNLPIYMILFFGLVLRLLYIREYSLLAEWEQLTVDNNFHHHWALSILNGNILGDTTYFRAPLYMFYLAGIYKLFGVSLWAVRLFNIVPGLLSIYLTYKTGSKIYNKQTGLVAGILHACLPIIYYFESELLLDSFFMLLLQIGIYFFIKWWKDDIVKDIFFSGLFLGLASITRPTALVVALFLLVVVLVVKKMKLKSVVLFALGISLCVGSVFIRNIVIADDPVMIASQGGINLYVGNNDAANGISAVLPEPLGFNWHIQQISYIAEKDLQKKLSQGEVSSYWGSKAIDWIQSNPKRFLQLYFEKLYHNISNREISNNRYLDQFFSKVILLKYNYLSFGVIFSLAIVSLLLTRRKNKQALLLAGIIVLYILVTSIFFFSSRFRLPIIPLYIILSAHTLVAIRILIKEKRLLAYKLIGFSIVVGLISFYPILSLPQGSSSNLYTSKGVFYSANGNHQKALAYFQQANELDTDYAENNLNIGATFLKLGEIDSAKYYIRREKSLHPLQSKGYTNCASLLHNLGLYDSAYTEIQKSLELEPYNLTANQLFVRILFRQDLSFIEIQKELFRVTQNTQNNIYLLNDIASLIYNDTTILNSLAIALLKDAIQSKPPPIETDDQSFSHHSLNTLENWTKQKALSYYHLGYIYGISGKFDNAILNSKKAIETDSTLADAYLNLVSGYFSINQSEEGKRILQIALEKFPHHINLNRLKNIISQ